MNRDTLLRPDARPNLEPARSILYRSQPESYICPVLRVGPRALSRALLLLGDLLQPLAVVWQRTRRKKNRYAEREHGTMEFSGQGYRASFIIELESCCLACRAARGQRACSRPMDALAPGPIDACMEPKRPAVRCSCRRRRVIVHSCAILWGRRFGTGQELGLNCH